MHNRFYPFLVFVILAIYAPSAQAASCRHEIDRVQAQVDARIEAIAANDPGAAETRAARLHHEPTPASIAAAERHRPGDKHVERALRALSRARMAEGRDNSKACFAALVGARAALAQD
jgi:hypothetical protein